MAATESELDHLQAMLSSLEPGQEDMPSKLTPSIKEQYSPELVDPEQQAMVLLTLRKPTELKKVVDSVVKPVRAVPKNGLPIWYRLGLECKLPVPKMPQGKIVFSRGKMGEDVRRIGLGVGVQSPSFDLTDPYCYTVSYDYVAVHDPHLKFYFRQKAASNRMKEIGFATPDGRAICSLKEFNTYRKYLYNRYMDRIHDEMIKLDERAKDDLTLKKVEADVARRQQAFLRTEKAREHLERHARIFADEIAEKKRHLTSQSAKKEVQTDVARRPQAFFRTEKAREHLERHARIFADEIAEKKRQTEKAREHLERHARIFADEIAEKKRQAKEQQKKIEARMQYLTEMNKQKRKERALRIQEKDNRVKQRVQAASEMELRRKITMIRQWRQNEKRRLQRVKQNRDTKIKKMEDDAERMWQKRVESQNRKIQEEAQLLQLYVDDMNNAAARRYKKAQIYAYNTDLQLQSIRIRNLRDMHGGAMKKANLIKKMGYEFEKSKRGAKGMTSDLAQHIARTAMSNALSTAGDLLMALGQARARMDLETLIPPAPIKILDMILENVVVEFARRRVHMLMRDIEQVVSTRAMNLYLRRRPSTTSMRSRTRFLRPMNHEIEKGLGSPLAPGGSITFGQVTHIAPEEEFTDVDLKRAKDRRPTPVPSLTKLAEVTFSDKIEDLPDPVTVAADLPERKKILEMINLAAKLMSMQVSVMVHKGLDLTVGKVTLPHMRIRLEWGEAVEGLSDAVVNNGIKTECDDMRRACEFLSHRILQNLQKEIRARKLRQCYTVVNNHDMRRACEFLSHRILQNLQKEIRARKLRQKSSMQSEGRRASVASAGPTDFYVPGQTASLPDEDTNDKNTTLQFSPSTMGVKTVENSGDKPYEAKKP
ncbi:hypothetical protein NE865_02980 [Phthorimaea operculella]|nr:hypothetical protein NE865_02980 [Phthorimaea operculella]